MGNSVLIWDAPPNVPVDASEARVEQLVVDPLLEALGYTTDERERLYAVGYPETDKKRPGRRPEADYAIFDGQNRTKANCLFVVEAKRPNLSLSKAAAQAEHYAAHLKALLYVVTDGIKLEIWQYQPTADSRLLIHVNIGGLPAARAEIEAILGRHSILEWRAKLRGPSLEEANFDISQYEAAETSRLRRRPRTICRVVSSSESRSPDAPDIVVDELLKLDGPGAIILARSGMGKTHVCTRLTSLSLGRRISQTDRFVPIEVSLPDVVVSGNTVLDFAFERVSRRDRKVTMDIFRDKLAAANGVDFFCDAFDRVPNDARAKVEVDLSTILRDYPQCRLFVFSRTSVVPDLELDTFFLKPLNLTEQQELEEALVGNETRKIPRLFQRNRNLPPIIERLCDSPLLLSWIVNFHRRNERLPDKLDDVFDFWLSEILRRDKYELSHHTELFNALQEIAILTTDAPISVLELMRHFQRKKISIRRMDELRGLDAITVSREFVEVAHEALADYLRAIAIREDKSPERRALQLEKQPLDRDAFFPTVSAAMTDDLELQQELFSRMAPVGVAGYMDAVRYKAKLSQGIAQYGLDRAVELFTDELLEGFLGTARMFFPDLVTKLIEYEAGAPGDDLSASARILEDGVTLSLSLETRVNVNTSALYTRSFLIDEDALDRARVFGLGILRLRLRQVIDRADFRGGKIWHEERLLSRLRLLLRRDVVFPSSFAIEAQKSYWECYAGSSFPAEGHYPAISVDDLLEDIRILQDAGIERLNVWWTTGEGEDALVGEWDRSDASIAEYHLRVDAAYREVVDRSFRLVAQDLETYGVLPRSWHVIPKEAGTRLILKGFWSPVKNWSEVAAQVSRDDIDVAQWAQETSALLARFGRRVGKLSFKYNFAPMFTGNPLVGPFDGKTAVVRAVCILLQNELKKYFEGVAPEVPVD